MDEVFLTNRGERHSLWPAVDQDGNVLDILVQSQRNKKSAKRFFRKLLKGLQYIPRVIITEKLKSYGAAKNGSQAGHSSFPPESLSMLHWIEHSLAERQASGIGIVLLLFPLNSLLMVVVGPRVTALVLARSASLRKSG